MATLCETLWLSVFVARKEMLRFTQHDRATKSIQKVTLFRNDDIDYQTDKSKKGLKVLPQLSY